MISKEERHNMRDAVLKQQKDWISDVIKEVNQQNFNIKVNVLWHNRPFEAIINHVINNKNVAIASESELCKCSGGKS